MKLAITGGGSGGHTLPAITIYNAFLERFNNQSDGFEALYIGSRTGIEKDVAERNQIPYYSISTGKLRRYLSLDNLIDILRILKGIIDSYKILRTSRPNVIFSTGGFVSVPVVIAAKLLNIPVLIHEQTSSVGLANKIASRFAQRVAISFESSKVFFPAHKVIHTGQPIRKELFTGSPDRCSERFKLDKTIALLYITGGSQGSHLINTVIKDILQDILPICNVIHQCGKTDGHNDFALLSQFKNSLNDDLKSRYIVLDFVQNELKDILSATTLLIGRSGAGTVCEAMALGIPAIFIPLAIATRNEQYHNAKIMADKGSAEIILEKELSPEKLKETILNIINHPQHLTAMRSGLSKDSNMSAIDLIIKTILEIQK